MVMDALGSHLASKLQLFGTDERTLTDDLCEMFFLYIWVQAPSTTINKYTHRALQKDLEITITKSTQQQEAEFGYDLAIRLTSPEGIKYALLQSVPSPR